MPHHQEKRCGWPSIIFTHYHQVEETLVRGKKVCQNIVVYDCSGLHLWAIGEGMPTGSFVRREALHFKPKVNGKVLHMFAWMDRVSQEQGVHITHKLNAGKEHRIGPDFFMGMMLRIKPCTNMMGVISMGITVGA